MIFISAAANVDEHESKTKQRIVVTKHFMKILSLRDANHVEQQANG